MSLFLGPMRHHIPGKKELTESVPLMELQPKKEVLYSFGSWSKHRL